MTDLAPTFANTGELTHHDLGCRCWPHVSEQDALDAIAAVGLAEYRDGKTRPAPEPSAEPMSESYVLAHSTHIEALRSDAWGIIANVSQGNWNEQTEEWREAAARWRDTYLATPEPSAEATAELATGGGR